MRQQTVCHVQEEEEEEEEEEEVSLCQDGKVKVRAAVGVMGLRGWSPST